MSEYIESGKPEVLEEYSDIASEILADADMYPREQLEGEYEGEYDGEFDDSGAELVSQAEFDRLMNEGRVVGKEHLKGSLDLLI